MDSWLVTVLLLASAANGSGGQSAVGKGWESVPVGLYLFPSQVHKCPSQATHVHNLTSPPLLIRINALSVEDFGHVLSRKEPVLIY